MPAINAMLEAGWTSSGITLEQTSSDAAAGYTKYFHDKDDAEMGGHWNIVSGKEELGEFMKKTFFTDGAQSFSQFEA